MARHFDQAVDLADQLLLPGLINAHTHTSVVLSRSLPEGYSLFTFDGWRSGREQLLTPELAPVAVVVSCVR